MPKPWKKRGGDEPPGPPRRPPLHAAIVVEELDLHGDSADEAEVRLEMFFARVAVSAPGDVVRVITGRGAGSPGPPVLQAVVRDALNGWLSHRVAEWAVDVGGGAYLVRVRG